MTADWKNHSWLHATPLIPITDHIMVMPLIGVVDAEQRFARERARLDELDARDGCGGECVGDPGGFASGREGIRRADVVGTVENAQHATSVVLR